MENILDVSHSPVYQSSLCSSLMFILNVGELQSQYLKLSWLITSKTTSGWDRNPLVISMTSKSWHILAKLKQKSSLHNTNISAHHISGPVMLLYVPNRCCPMGSHASCFRSGSCQSVLRNKSSWTWQSEPSLLRNLSTPVSLSAIRTKQCTYTCVFTWL